MAGSRGKLDDGYTPFPELGPEGPDRLCGHRDRLEPEVRLKLELGHQAVEPLSVGSAGIDGDAHPAGDHVHRSRLDVDLTDGGHGSVDGSGDVTHSQDVLGGSNQRVEPPGHRNRARVAGLPFEGALPPDDADDPHRQSQWNTRPLQDRPLFDVHLEEALGKRPALDEGRAADAAAFLVPEDCDGSLTDALDRLDRRDDSQRTVELAAEGTESR